MTLILHFYAVYLLLRNALSSSPLPRRRLAILHHHTRPCKVCSGWVLGGEATATGECEREPPPRALRCSLQACCAAEQGRDPDSWADSSPEHGHLPLLAPSLATLARLFAGLDYWFLPASHWPSGRSFRTGPVLSDSALALPWRGLALFKRRARIGLSRGSGGSVRGVAGLVDWLVLATSAFGMGQMSLRAWAMV